METIIPQRSIGFPEQIRVEPNIANLILSSKTLQVIVEIGVKGNQTGLKLDLETDVPSLEVQLGVLVESDADLVVGKLGTGEGVELDAGLAVELPVELQAVVGGEVVVEEALLGNWWP